MWESRTSPGINSKGGPRARPFVFCTISRERRALVEIVTSRNGIPIRLTDGRWAHISEEHCELTGLRREVLEAVANPVRIYAGGAGELLAAREIDAGKWLVVVYRELGHDGFVITAFLTRRLASLERRKQLWP